MEYQRQLAELSSLLVTPERFGRLALLPNLEYALRDDADERLAIQLRFQHQLSRVTSEHHESHRR